VSAGNGKGLKRICMNCGARFYDMNKNPIICPSCETEYTGEIKVKSRRGRAASTEKAEAGGQVAPETQSDESEEDAVEEDDDLVSLEDVDEGDDDLDDSEDLDIDDDLGDLDIDDDDEDIDVEIEDGEEEDDKN